MSLDPKAAILALAADGPLVPLEGVEGAFIRRLSIAEVDQLAEFETDSGLQMLVMAIVDAEGNRLFSGSDISKLRKIKANAFNTISRQVTKVNRMGEAAAGDLEKN